MKYIFDSKDEGKIEIPVERWSWVVVYKDGRIFQQFDPLEEKFHQVGEIDQSQIERVMMVCHSNPREVESGRSSLIFPWEDGMKLVHKYRNITLDVFGEARKYRVYIIGWKKGSEQIFHYILPDDRIITTTDENYPISTYL